MPKEIAFSESTFDQRRLSQSGGYITIKPNGRPVFRFDNEQQYQKYLELNKKKTSCSELILCGDYD